MFSKKKYFFSLFLVVGSFCGSEVEALQIEPSTQVTSRDQNTKKELTKKEKKSPAKEIYVIRQEDLFSKTDLNSQMMSQVQEMQIQFNKEANEIARQYQELNAEYEKKAATATKDALAPIQEKMKSLMQKMTEIDASYREYMENVQKEYVEKLFKETEAATKAFLTKSENVNAAIVNAGAGTYVHPKFDITDDIISSINANLKKTNKESKKNDSKKSSKE